MESYFQECNFWNCSFCNIVPRVNFTNKESFMSSMFKISWRAYHVFIKQGWLPISPVDFWFLNRYFMKYNMAYNHQLNRQRSTMSNRDKSQFRVSVLVIGTPPNTIAGFVSIRYLLRSFYQTMKKWSVNIWLKYFKTISQRIECRAKCSDIQFVG